MEHLIKKFKEKNSTTPIEMYSPGRINIIGEHIDYVGGKVMPAAISLKFHGFVQKSDSIQVFSENFHDLGWYDEKFDIHKLAYKEELGYVNFVNGAFKVLYDKGYKIDGGITIVVNSTIPVGSGLSSSASFSIFILKALNTLYSLEISEKEMALLAKAIENDFFGLKTGIMDQFAIALSKPHHLMLLDTNTLDYEYIKFDRKDIKLFLISSNKQRALAGSKYNERVKELEQVSKILFDNGLKFKELSDIKDLSVLDLVDNETLKRRLKHVITENDRVHKMLDINNMDKKELGNLINECHDSLKNDYEVSCVELDYLHEKINSFDNILGSRIMGAGFGGCLLVVASDEFSLDKITFNPEYSEKFDLEFDIFELSI